MYPDGMSFAPAELLECREYVRSQTGLPYNSLGIVGDDFHDDGYHLGKDRIYADGGKGDEDYSVTSARDRAGLTDAASAFDIGLFNRNGRTLLELTRWMVTEAKAGRRPDTREIIGPAMHEGRVRAFRWAHEASWVGRVRLLGDSHETHVHESFYRDSQTRDKVRFFRGFFEEGDMALTKADAKTVLTTDGILGTPSLNSTGGPRPTAEREKNPHWTAETYLEAIYNNIARNRAGLASLEKDLTARLDKITARLEAIESGAVTVPTEHIQAAVTAALRERDRRAAGDGTT